MKALHIFAVAAAAIVAASCSSKPDLSYLPAKAEDDSNWGLVDADGEFLFTDEFSNRPSPAVNGLFFVEEGNGYTVYNAEKSPRQVGDLVELKDCGFYNDGVMPVVHKGEYITFVDKDGKVKFTLDQVDGVNVKCAMGMFINGRCAFCTADDKWGVIDSDGNVVIKPKYSQQPVFVENRVLVNDAETGKAVIIDRDGNIKATLSEDIVGNGIMLDGYACSMTGDYDDDDRRCVMVDDSGEVIRLPASAKYVYIWNDKYIVFENSDSKTGIMTYDGEIKVRPKYDGIELLANGDFIGRRDEKYMFIMTDGETEKLPKETYAAVRSPYLFSKILDFKFELATEKDGEIRLRSYNGDKKGDKMERFRNRIEIYNIYSDYFDYADATKQFIGIFDAEGLKGYPFGSMMSRYADSSHSVEWYRGDRSISIKPECSNPYFYISSAAVYSNNNIVYDATPYQSYYTWEFYPESRVDRISLTLTFNGSNYRADLGEYFSKALREKFGAEVPYYAENAVASDDSYITTNGYDAITVNITRRGWAGSAEAIVEDVVVADTVCCPVDTVWIGSDSIAAR